MTKDQIRQIFLAHGFTIKEGQTDLKQYVYDAAEALLKASVQQAEPVDGCTEENCRRCRTPEALRTPDMYHAGLSAAAELADEVCANSRNHLFRSGAKVVAGAIRSAAPAPKDES